MRKLLALWVAVFSLLGFAAIVAVVALRPEEEEFPIPEPEIVYYPDNFAISNYSPVVYGSEGEYVAALCNISYPSSLTSDLFSYQWYVYTPARGNWIPSSFTGNDTSELIFQMNHVRADYLFICVVSSSAYDYSLVSPVISCRMVSESKSASDIVLDYYEPWELEDLDKDTLAAYEEKQKEREL